MTLWLDLTKLVGWSGPLTGIQRAEYEFARRAVGDGARLIHHPPQARAFAQLPAGFLADLERRIRLPGPAKDRRITGARRRVRRLRRAVRRARATLAGALGRAARRGQTGSQVEMQSGDTLLIIGLPWLDAPTREVMRRATADHGVRLVVLIHDVIPALLPHVVADTVAAGFVSALGETLALSDLVVTTAPVTTSAITDLLGNEWRGHLVDVALGSDPPGGEEVEPESLGLCGEPFLLMVGTIEARKNYQLAYQAYRLAHERGTDLPRLVIVSRRTGWLADDIDRTMRLDPAVRDRIVIAHDIADDGLRWLYRHCAFLLSTSVAEGWGLPITEAVAFGKVCVSSDLPSVRAAVGDHAVYFSPYDSSECLERIVEMLDDDRRHVLEQRLLTVPPRTWDDWYRELSAVVGTPPPQAESVR